MEALSKGLGCAKSYDAHRPCRCCAFVGGLLHCPSLSGTASRAEAIPEIRALAGVIGGARRSGSKTG